MLTPLPGQALPTSKFSKQTVKCLCSCGNPNVLEVRWLTFTREKPTCGKCVVMRWRASGTREYGRLSLMTDPDTVTAVRDVLAWRCACGKEKDVPLYRVLSGNTRSCGCAYNDKRPGHVRTNVGKTKSEWMQEMPALLDEELPGVPWTKGSRLRAKFRCECGNVFENPFHNYKIGKECGRCDEIEIERGTTVNGFTYDGERTRIKPKSTEKALFKCGKCGSREEMIIRYVWNGETVRCSQCNVTEVTVDQKFGRLRFKEPGKHKKYSTEKVGLLCDCGNETEATVSNILNGVTKSCGSCRTNVALWYQENEVILRAMKCPIRAEDFPPGGMGIIGSIRVANEPFQAVCPVCSNPYEPRFGDIRLGKSLTCGCTTDRVSSGQREVCEFVRSLGFDAGTEKKINGLRYDVFVPEKNLVIEYNGLLWHSLPDSRRRDMEKYEAAKAAGCDYIMMFEDEWMRKKEIMKSFLQNRLGVARPVGMRPGKIEAVSSKVADEFYSRTHYIGGAKAPANYGIRINGQLMACASFKRPTRQSQHDWELVRMASDPSVRIHGIWSKITIAFIQGRSPSSIVSFSDNRLFSGSVYEKIGFRHDGETSATYFWVRGVERHHASNMRKREDEEGTERSLREAEGFKKIWDVGKRRWVWRPGEDECKDPK